MNTERALAYYAEKTLSTFIYHERLAGWPGRLGHQMWKVRTVHCVEYSETAKKGSQSRARIKL